MANGSYININFPFKNSPKGFYLDLNSTDDKAIKADLMHLVLTRKGQRLYNPDFGTDLLKYIFEPNDAQNLADIKSEISAVIKKYIPNLVLTNLTVEQSTESEYAAVIRMDYQITNNVFTNTDFIIIKI